MIREVERKAAPGLLTLLLLSAGTLASTWGVVLAARGGQVPLAIGAVVVLMALLTCLGGLFIVNPNEAKVLILFGRYAGTVKTAGFWWVNPFMVKKKVSLRVRNFETSKMKVNDSQSNPVEIAAVVVWRVVETAEALFEVDDYEHYVTVQSESAVRTLASRYPYDQHSTGDIALSSHPAEVSRDLLLEVQERLGKAGVEVTEARISHLAYAPEIASAMLQRQQATAIIAARQKIVEGAVGMVENALEMLSERRILELDAERRATMVSNLLVVLCSERGTQPVVNAGTLYQ
jgi:regulator of protease activity HflC (stomatin/prohibitin superfamily)